MKSILTKNQKLTFNKIIKLDNDIPCQMSVTIRYDDECGNGHNTFSITGTIKGLGAHEIEMAGCLHDEISEYFPEFAHLIKWHLVSSDSPLHYIANTKYYIKKGNIELAKDTAVWGVTNLDTDENIKFLDDDVFLQSRLPKLLEAFKKDVESLGFIY